VRKGLTAAQSGSFSGIRRKIAGQSNFDFGF